MINMGILPDTHTQKTSSFAERIRVLVEKSELYFNDIPLKITISLGVVSINESMEIDRFIDREDKVLYKAKEKKNVVSLWGYIKTAEN